jgi:hypothetical protein
MLAEQLRTIMNNRVKDPLDIDFHIEQIKHAEPADIDS